jgi:hypothetical protein
MLALGTFISLSLSLVMCLLFLSHVITDVVVVIIEKRERKEEDK